MDINQDMNSQKTAIDLSQLNLPKHQPEVKPAPGQGTGSGALQDAVPGASTVSISEEGRAASIAFDFNATADNLAKLDALGSLKSFTKAHASISYENVKNLLG